jgi:hypothetical protein
MKRFLTSGIIAVALAGVAAAQVEEVYVERPSNTYLEIGTTFEEETIIALGTGVNAGAVSAFAELSGTTDSNFKARAYTEADLGKFKITPGLNYNWGADGGDIIGLGEGNEWGEVTADLELSIHPKIVGGEYAFANTEVGFDGWSLDWRGGEVGAGYKLDLAENVYLDGRVSWSYDDQFEGGQRRILAGIGLRF